LKTTPHGAVDRVLKSYPPGIRRKLLSIRALILETAASMPGVGDIEETLKWGEPAYVTAVSKSGSTIRIGWKKSAARQLAIYFNCQTTLVETFRTLFPKELKFEGNRAIIFEETEPLPVETLAFCIGAALTYHRTKRPNRARHPRPDYSPMD
jgi:Domain of unknown function (DU1801)